MRIYISGPISNAPDHPAHFASAEERLKREGHETVNPAAIGKRIQGLVPFEMSWNDYMRIDEGLLQMCEGIHMLKGYENSAGAKRELMLATKLGLAVTYEEVLP